MTVAIGPGSTFAGYRVESLVGRGGMGVVYLATDLSLERPVALKLIAPELARDERFRTRFLKEPRLAAALEHPHVIPIHAAGEHEGQLYLAMRYVEGSDLKTILERERKLAPERMLAILAQIAGALDAAHRRGLVHRDVKPANVLLDEEEHAYLTDFGITKQLGGDSTDTGQVVGTLDYLAPEQIRGEPVDGRTDCYALACVLYECLSGTPPFRRETEAETLWAHMQEQPAPLRGHEVLDPVLKKALAKETEDRYASCAELIEAAGEALGLATRPPVRRRLVPRALVRRGRVILAAGLLLLAGTITAVIVALTTDGGSRSPPADSGVLALDAAEGRVGSFTEYATPPSNIAVGEGAVWALNTEDDTVSRIDPKTKRVVKTFESSGRPSDLAVGAGAVWVGNGGGRYRNFTASISRVDPDSAATTRTVKLPDTSEGAAGSTNPGLPRIAVGAGAVWAINPDDTLSRIDPETGRLVATIDVGIAASTIAAGEEGVWFLSWENRSLMRLDPRTNRVTERIPLGSHFLSGIAVGGGSVWVTAQDEGLLWRVEPVPRPSTRTIDVGVGATYVAFGDGAAWTGNHLDGVVSRVDPRTNSVTARVRVGAAQALGAGAGSAWVSVAGAPRDGTLPASSCTEVASGGNEPDVLIASDLALQGPEGAAARGLADAIRFVLKDNGFRAGEYVVGYQSCDDSTAQTGRFEDRKCAANANAYAHAERLVAVIGPYNSGCAQVEIPILNRAPGGPLALISPSTTYSVLTRGGRLSLPPPFGSEDEPEVYYPTGTRNFLRLPAREDLQGVALAVLARRLELKGIYLLHDPLVGGNVAVTDPFRRVASRLGVRIAGSEAFDNRAKSYDALADKVARSGADGVLIGGTVFFGSDRLLKALRARLGPRATIMAGDGFVPIPDLLELAGRAARGLYVAISHLPPDAVDLSAAGQRFTRDLGETAHEEFALQAGQATEVVLQAIASSDGTRASVLRELRATRVKDGILGDFRFDRYGDITPANITILRATGRTPPRLGLPSFLEGAAVDRVVTVPASLAR
jgi:ABC-type branched-subunit amino acid transport system substrate-binding protein/DNA-binding beta-propeller fold protein YncE/predicted Ser/Thr protein kinase